MCEWPYGETPEDILRILRDEEPVLRPVPTRIIIGSHLYDEILDKWPEEPETVERMFYRDDPVNGPPVVGAPSLLDEEPLEIPK